jgi:RHS repeat-associated protein
VTTTVGDSDPGAGVALKREKHLYMRGMNGDRDGSGGTRHVTVTDSQGGVIDDDAPLTGFVREQTSYNGDAVVSSTIKDPWTAQTASRTQSWGTIRAYLTDIGAEHTRTPLASGGTRVAATVTTFDSTYGLKVTVDEQGDGATTGDDRCTRYEYARNTSAYLVEQVKRAETVGVRCSATPVRPDDVLSDERTSFDGQDYGTVPTKGDETRQERVKDYVDGAAVYQTVSTASYDTLGRVTQERDALDNPTTTAYTPDASGPLTKTVVTDALGHSVTTGYEPAWAQELSTVDANGRRTELTYDPLGRVTAVYQPNRSKAAGQQPNIRYAYTVANDAAVAVATSTLKADGTSYNTGYTIYDSLLRPRQTQAPAPNGGRIITDTSYDSRGLAVRGLTEIYNSDAPSATLVSVDAGAAPAQTVTTFDGAARPTVEAFIVLGVERWRTTISYNGEQTSVTPPSGAVAVTTITDAQGNVTERREYDGGTPTGSYVSTSYAYDHDERLTSITDADGNAWTDTYDLRGRKIREVDPDHGATDSTYDDLDRLVTTTDARGQILAYSYDALDRKTGLYKDAVDPANQLAGWTYDTVTKGIGQLASATRYVGGATGSAYTTAVDTYDELYRITREHTTIPVVEGNLAGTYTTTASFNLDGTVKNAALPAAGGLAAELLVYGYNGLGMPTTQSGANTLVADTSYTDLGEPAQYTLRPGGLSSKHAWITRHYEDGTRRLTRSFVADETNASSPSDLNYTYDTAGKITRLSDAGAGTTDTQCYTYDGHQRLTTAWTPASGDCAAAPTVAGLGGPAPYWQSWTYHNATGLRASQTDHRTGGDVTTSYTYPAAGTTRPHALSSTTTGGTTASYDYDQTGNTTTRPGATGPQTLTWDPEGRVATLTEGAATSGNLYDADGDRLIRRDPTETVLYLGHTEIHANRATGALSGVRYYTHNGETIAVRTNTGLQWVISDHHGTPLVTLNATDQAVTRRYETPFGGSRGPQPATWPSQKGFVGGVTDPATGLTHLGARDYDPNTGRFLSVDPVLDPKNPQSLAAYTYADNNPVNLSDPDGNEPRPWHNPHFNPKKFWVSPRNVETSP